jgi:pyruvate/2-oxoglutarate dehydrogenase complex dihydrolipoamide acyltransferase (E2) component
MARDRSKFRPSRTRKREFRRVLRAYDDLITRARNNKLTVDDLTGATISLTNPGTVGTVGRDSAA